MAQVRAVTAAAAVGCHQAAISAFAFAFWTSFFLFLRFGVAAGVQDRTPLRFHERFLPQTVAVVTILVGLSVQFSEDYLLLEVFQVPVVSKG